MSPSTVSVTPNPRRRPSPLSDAKKSVEIVTDAINNKISVENVGIKDLTHSIRGEASILEKLKDKKSSQFPNSDPPTRTRIRKVSNSKPRWRTVVSVWIKNLLLLFVLVGFIQIVRNLAVNNNNNGGSLGFSNLEDRIVAVESLIKTTSDMLQVEVDVLDSKIGNEVGNWRKEVNRKIEDRVQDIDKKVVELEEKNEGLETKLDEMRSKEVVNKNDLLRIYDELKKGEGGSIGLSLDEIRVLAKEVVEKEIEKHGADGLGRVDFALGTGGAMVVGHSEPLYGGKLGSWLSGNSKDRVHGDAGKILMPSFGEPGHCFALKGSRGHVLIRLRAAIVPEAVTLEHVAKSVAYDRSSAPKHCRVSGLLVGEQKSLETLDNYNKIILTDFIYDLDKSHAQTFDVIDKTRTSIIDTVLFEFSSNHGSSTHTCIYRVRVHGHEHKLSPVVHSDS